MVSTSNTWTLWGSNATRTEMCIRDRLWSPAASGGRTVPQSGPAAPSPKNRCKSVSISDTRYFVSVHGKGGLSVWLSLIHILRKTPKDEIDKRVHEAAKILEIEHLLDRKPKALSGGQRQRVALGRAMVRNPAVFLLDEPLSNLDAKLRTSMRTEIIKLHKKLATTFIYVTHDQTEAMTMGDRIVVMKDGIIQQVDTPQNLYDMPCNMFVAGFIGSPQMNFLDGTLIKKGDQYGIDLGGDIIPLPKEKTADGKLDAYVGKKIKMGIRPEDIDDEPEFMAKHTDCQLDAQVDVSEMMGAEIYLYLEYKGNKMTARVAPTSKARNGDTVRVAFDPHKVHVFDVETEQTILN